MKVQYLGDSKDSFKWDYHDFLMSKLNYRTFKIILMMTQDDGGNDGNTHASNFPARSEILEFCNQLRNINSIEKIKELPVITSSSYEVCFHKENNFITNENRYAYFSDFEAGGNQLFF
jgi:hypothetical protein